jgi:hypothetical protein
MSVTILYSCLAARCGEGDAQDEMARLCHDSVRRLDVRRGSQRKSYWNACRGTGCRTCSPSSSLCIEPSLRNLSRRKRGQRNPGSWASQRDGRYNWLLISAICSRNCVCALAAAFARRPPRFEASQRGKRSSTSKRSCICLHFKTRLRSDCDPGEIPLR